MVEAIASDRMALYREAMKLHDEEGLGYICISRKLGLPEGTVSHWLYRGKVPNRKNRCWTLRLTKETDERIRKVAEARKGQIPWNKGKHFSEETREKMRLAKLGKPHSTEHVQKMAEANRGKKRSAEFCRKQSERMKGKALNPKGQPLSLEHRQHISEANKGRKIWCEGMSRSEETRRKIAEALNGHSVSEEAKRKIREKRLEQVFPVKDTLIEVALQNELRKRGIAFRTHVPLLGKYQVDIFIEPDVIVECRGDYWHNFPDGREQDRKRDEELKEAGYIVFSFWEHEIRTNPEDCVSKILSGFERDVKTWRSF